MGLMPPPFNSSPFLFLSPLCFYPLVSSISHLLALSIIHLPIILPCRAFFIPPSPIVLSRLQTISAENRNRQENPTQAKGVKKRIEAGDKKQNQISRFQTAQNSQNQTADKTIKQQNQNLEMRKSKKRSKRGRHLRTHLDNPPP